MKFFTTLLVFFLVLPSIAQNTIILKKDFLRVTFDNNNGALIGLENSKTGWKIQNRAELGRSFQMLIPVPGKRDNQIYGEYQQLTESKVSPDGNQITLVWNGLTSEFGGRHDITFTAVVSINENGLTFESTVINHSPNTVEAVNYPIINDLSSPSKDIFKVMAKGYSGLENTELLPHFTNGKGYWGTMNPTISFPQQYILIGNDQQGLYVGNCDSKQKSMVEFNFKLHPGYQVSALNLAPSGNEISGIPVNIEFSAVQFPFVLPDETVTLSPTVLQSYQGEWSKGVDIYKTWRKTWHKELLTPKWVSDVNSWQQIRIFSSEDHILCSYKDLIKYGQECAVNGVSAIQLTGWDLGGQDRSDPSCDTDPALGTWYDLHDAIEKIEKMGVHVVLFNKYVWGDRSSDWYRKELYRYAAKDPYGDAYFYGGYSYDTQTQLSDINTRRYSPMCMLSSEYRKIAVGEFEKVLKLGGSGMLYDENAHHGPAKFCFDPTHGHRVPTYIYEGDMNLGEEFHVLSDQYNKEFLYAGETFGTNPLSNYYHLSYTRFGNSYIPLERYEDPFMPMMAAVHGFDDREMINLCLMYRYIISYEPYNFKGHLSDFPLTLEYGKKVDDLRKKYKEYLWDTEFVFQNEASVSSGSAPYPKYSVFKNPVTQKRSVVIANQSTGESVTVTVAIENGKKPLYFTSPENSELIQLKSNTLTIPARSLIIVIEK